MNGVGRRVEDVSSWYELQEEPRSSNRALDTLVVYYCNYNVKTDITTKVQVAKIDWEWDGSKDNTQVVHIRNQALWNGIPEDLKRTYVRKMVEFWSDRH